MLDYVLKENWVVGATSRYPHIVTSEEAVANAERYIRSVITVPCAMCFLPRELIYFAQYDRVDGDFGIEHAQ